MTYQKVIIMRHCSWYLHSTSRHLKSMIDEVIQAKTYYHTILCVVLCHNWSDISLSPVQIVHVLIRGLKTWCPDSVAGVRNCLFTRHYGV